MLRKLISCLTCAVSANVTWWLVSVKWQLLQLLRLPLVWIPEHVLLPFNFRRR